MDIAQTQESRHIRFMKATYLFMSYLLYSGVKFAPNGDIFVPLVPMHPQKIVYTIKSFSLIVPYIISDCNR